MSNKCFVLPFITFV